MIRFWIGCLLAELAFVGAVVGLAVGLNVYDAAYWRTESQTARFDLAECQRRHAILIKQIKAEGLWKRLGMGGQPWLGDYKGGP